MLSGIRASLDRVVLDHSLILIRTLWFMFEINDISSVSVNLIQILIDLSVISIFESKSISFLVIEEIKRSFCLKLV